MSNEELKKKIVGVLSGYKITTYDENNNPIFNTNIPQELLEDVAETLIVAGIGDVSELKKHRVIVEQSPVPTDDNCYILPNTSPIIKQLYSGKEVEQIAKERDEYKHRAEVTERALENLAYKIAVIKLSDMSTVAMEKVKSAALQQAEKELAEERKDD